MPECSAEMNWPHRCIFCGMQILVMRGVAVILIVTMSPNPGEATSTGFAKQQLAVNL